MPDSGAVLQYHSGVSATGNAVFWKKITQNYVI